MSSFNSGLTVAVLSLSLFVAAGATTPSVNEPTTATRATAQSEYKAAIAKAKADRKTARADCDKLVDAEKKGCRSNASKAYTQAERDAKAEYNRKIAESKKAPKAS